MANRGGWYYSPRRTSRPSRPKVHPLAKAELENGAQRLLDLVLKPKYLKPSPAEPQFNYIIDLRTKWHSGFFYLFSVYQVAGSEQTFEAKFARFEHAGHGRFHLAFQRHTGEWITLFTDQTIDECLDLIEHEAFLQP
jgi:hypothetical protein